MQHGVFCRLCNRLDGGSAGAPVEMNVGHLHQAVGVCGRFPAHQFEQHQLADGVQGNLVDLGRLGEQGPDRGALQQLATEVLAGGGFRRRTARPGARA